MLAFHMPEMQPLADLMRKMPVVGVATAAFPLLALLALALVTQRAELRRDFGFLAAAASFVLAFVIMVGVTKIYSYALWLGLPLVSAAILHLFQRLALNSLVGR